MNSTLPLHASLGEWFHRTYDSPTEAQMGCVPRILEGESVLLSAPTGSGKTLAGFLGILDALARRADAGELRAATYAIYISPLRALTYDIEKNLMQPLRGAGLEDTIRIALRTGDTTSSERARQRRKPPHIYLTTPESLAIMLGQEAFKKAFATCEYVIIDELHALAANKRGTHLMLSLERLEALRAESVHTAKGQEEKPPRPPSLCRIGLSATVAPLPEVAKFLAGCASDRTCQIVETEEGRGSIVEVLSPLRREPYPPAGFTAARVIRDIADLVSKKESVLVFCNTRSGAESTCHRLKTLLPKLAAFIEVHHSSLGRDVRLEVEDRLKHGELRAVVCSTSLELGIDIGSVDAVIMISTPKGITRALQRIGRSGHSIHEISHGIMVATNINDLVECTVCAEMTRRRQLDEVRIPVKSTDVLAQHLVGMALGDGITRADAFDLVTRSYPYRELPREEFDGIVDYLKGGGRSLNKEYRDTFGKLVEDAKTGLLEAANARVKRDYLLNVGTIVAEGMVRVYLGRKKLGEVEEGFIRGIKVGDVFVLAGRVVRLVETGVAEAKVKDAGGAMPNVPTWNANKMPLASGLANEVTRLRGTLDDFFESSTDENTIRDWLVETFTISSTNAASIVEHFQNQRSISLVPRDGRMLVEAYHPKREDGSEKNLCHFFFHSLIGRSANDALSRIVSHRVKEAVGGNTMVTIDDYGFLLTLQSFQDMGLEEWRELFKPENAKRDLQAALESSELVKWLFRGVAQTGLMVPRNLPGKERNLKQVRWSSEILFQVLIKHEPDHPLLAQAYRDAKHAFLHQKEAIDFLEQAADFEWKLVEVPAVTPFSFGIFTTKIKEGMMLEDPEEAIERLYQKMQLAMGKEKGGKPADFGY